MINAKLTGADLYQATTTLLNGFAIDQTIFYQLLNTARANREALRPWQVLKKLDVSQTATPSDTYLTAKTLPSDFVRLARESKMILFDNVQTFMTYWEVPMELKILYKDEATKFFIDHGAMQFFLCGIVDRTYYINLNYIADYGDIDSAGTWQKFPHRFDMILAYDVAAMWRLGVDYDDINARNGDYNGRMAEKLYNSMEKWDDELALSSVTNLDYPIEDSVDSFIPHKINMNDLG